ncbi:MAG: hypothetical protein ACOC80_15000, partial [Petrotogales bacterium]
LKMQKKLSQIARSIVYVILRDSKDVEEYREENYVVTNSTKAISVYHALKNIKEKSNLHPDSQ